MHCLIKNKPGQAQPAFEGAEFVKCSAVSFLAIVLLEFFWDEKHGKRPPLECKFYFSNFFNLSSLNSSAETCPAISAGFYGQRCAYTKEEYITFHFTLYGPFLMLLNLVKQIL